MDARYSELHPESTVDPLPLLMEHQVTHHNSDLIIDITGNSDASTSSSAYYRSLNAIDRSLHENRPLSSEREPVSNPRASSSNGANSRNSASVRRGDARRRRGPLNSGIWISVELVLAVSQIVASVIVLSLSSHEHPRTPLFAWIVGYASGCVATIPLLYWRYRQHNPAPEQGSPQPRQTSSQINVPAGPFSLSVARTGGEDYQTAAAPSSRSSQGSGVVNPRFKVLVEYFKMALDCFFAVWFVVGNVWIFGGHSSASDAPNLYRLCVVLLIVSCIGYAMPFILCATICCCLPCIIQILGFREDLTLTRGAATNSINSLPTYKFKSKNRNNNESNSSAGEGGIVAAGTDKERVISGEDAVCCICLAKYDHNDELRELPCCHFFHKECVDKWLKINALCPLCKREVGDGTTESVSRGNANAMQQRDDNLVLSSTSSIL